MYRILKISEKKIFWVRKGEVFKENNSIVSIFVSLELIGVYEYSNSCFGGNSFIELNLEMLSFMKNFKINYLKDFKWFLEVEL